VGGKCLTWRSDIVICSFNCHERGSADRIGINLVAAKRRLR
jgi:hypothetical protein